MAGDRLTTAAFLWGDRQLSPGLIARQVQRLAESGAVDYLSQSAQLWRLIPRQLWKVDNAPMAALIEDPDVMQDAFLIAAHCHAAAPSLGVSLLSETFHTGPAQLRQTMSTLTHLTEGRTLFHLGAAQLRQLEPTGARGVSRASDLPEIFERFSQDSGPFDHKGPNWTLEAAWWLGGVKPFHPRVHAMGSDPVLIDHATSYADGLSVAVPSAWTSPEECAQHIVGIREQLERKGRDPDGFRFGMFCPVLIHEDENVLDAALDNPIVRWIAATFGQIQRDDWTWGGSAPAGTDRWSDDAALLWQRAHAARVDEVLAGTTRADAERAYFWGTPARVAARLAAYVEAGVSFVSPADFLPVVGDPADAQQATDRSIACLGRLKSAAREPSPRSPHLGTSGMRAATQGDTWVNTN